MQIAAAGLTGQDAPTAGASGPDLSISLTHTSAFLQGQTNAVYLIRVTNEGGTPTTGTISVIEMMPSGITISSMSGPGWSCLSNTCNRSDSVQPGQMLPTITVLATVDQNAPPSVSNMVSVSGGGDALIANNFANDVTTIAAEGWLLGWGYSYSPALSFPASLSDVVSVATGSDHAIALRKDGTVVEWGLYGILTPPASLTLTGVIAVAAGYDASYALKSDGSVLVWSHWLATPSTASLANVVSIAAYSYQFWALNANGTLTSLAINNTTPDSIPGGATNIVQVSANYGGVLALTSMGGVLAWGNNAPQPPVGLERLVRLVFVGNNTGVGIKGDGTLAAWSTGSNGNLSSIPSGINNVTGLAGDSFVMALKGDGTVAAWGSTSNTLWQSAGALSHARQIQAASQYGIAILDAAPVPLKIQSFAKDYDLSNVYYYAPTVTLDGQVVTPPYSALVAPGSAHTIATAASQTPTAEGVQYTFSNWSDGGAISHSITADGVTIYTVNYSVKFRLTTSADSGGSISPASAYYDPGSTVLVRVTPSDGYVLRYVYDGSPQYNQNNPIRVEMNGPRSVTAYFSTTSTAGPRLTLKPMRQLIQGQQNAVYVGRYSNESATSLTGAQVSFSGLTVTRMFGSGWTCSSNQCSRSDTLLPGKAYPAILIVAATDRAATGTLLPYLSAYGTYSSPSANAPSKVYGAGNAVIAWGNNSAGQLAAPAGLTNLVEVAGGSSHSVALRGDGTAAAWGDNSKLQTKIPGNLVDLIAIAAGGNHSLALNSTGSVVAWGDNSSGQASVPANLTNVIAVAAGASHSLALGSDGSVVAWGANASGQCTVPANVKDAVAIAAGGDHSLAVLRDGTVVAWGSNAAGESTVPSGLSRVETVSAGSQFSLAVQDDGTVVPWGSIPASIVSSMPAGLTNVRVLAAGGAHALALQWDQTFQTWGVNTDGQTTIPQGLTKITSVGAGAAHSLAVASAPAVVDFVFQTSPFGASFSVDGVTYTSGQSFQWPYGSSHTVSVPAAQPGPTPGSQYVLTSWGDGYSQSSRVISATQNLTYTLTFKLQYLLTATATGGSISPGTSYLDAGSIVTLTATPTQGNVFAGFSGDMSGLQNPRTVVMKGPLSVTANFVVPQGKAKFKVDLRHTSAFLRGQTNAVYLVRISSDPTGGSTSGQVQMTPTVPTGLQVNSMSGRGWSCTSSVCSRSDVLPSGGKYPAITVVAHVLNNAPASLLFQVGVAGGGAASAATAGDTTAVNSTAVPVSWPPRDPYYYNSSPWTLYPEGLTDAVAVAPGSYHSLALKKDGTVAAWGSNDSGQCDVPANLANVIAVTAGDSFSVALKADGSLVAWGAEGVITQLPAGLTDVVGIAAGGNYSVAIKSDGTLSQWGSQYSYGIDPSKLAQVRDAVAVSSYNSLFALTSDGVPVPLVNDSSLLPPPSLSGVTSIYTSYYSISAVGQDGTLTRWGNTSSTTLPAEWVNLASVVMDGDCPVALKKDGTFIQGNCSIYSTNVQPKSIANVTALAGYNGRIMVLTSTPPQVTVAVSASQGPITVDGTTYQQSRTFTWPYNSIHTIAASSPIDGAAGTRQVFAYWNDGGAISHSFVAASTGTMQLQANFKTQYYLTTKATQGGTISPTSGWYDSGYTLVYATPDQGYSFKDFTNASVNSGTYGYLYLYAPTTVTANFVSTTSGPKLAITSSHTGSFTQGQQGASFTLTVSNANGSPATTGSVYVIETLPAGLTPLSMSGPGWYCQNSNSCYRSDTLAGGASYPPITITVNVGLNASSPQVLQATVTGGSSPQASTSDSATILTLINLMSSPSGLAVIADGVTYTTPKALGWAAGSSHTLTITSPQTAGNTRYPYLSWSDGGGQSHVVTTPTTATTYTANFKTQNKLTTSVLPAGAGTLAVTPVSADGWYDNTQVLQVTATPGSGNTFSSFSGDLTGTVNPQSLAMVAPRSVVANFAAINPQPSAVSVSPSSGSGPSASFTAVYSSGLGYQNLAWVQMLVATAPDGGGQTFCMLHYDINGDSFWLYGDEGFFVGPVKRGTPSAALQNSLCALNTKTTTVTTSGTTLTWKADIVFKAAATRNVYLRAMAYGNLDTGLVLKGTWTSSASALATMSALPSSGTGAQQTFAASFPDPAGFEGAPLGWSQFLIASASDGGGQPFCFVHYDRAGNGLWVYSGDVGFFLGPVSPGTASNTLTSGACSVNPAGTTITNVSGVLTVNVPITLKAPMSGAKKIYQRTLDPLRRDTGWVQTGTWTIP
ncbi:MAG: hypothetical protein QM757_14530 [Paludibaculum sp.]